MSPLTAKNRINSVFCPLDLFCWSCCSSIWIHPSFTHMDQNVQDIHVLGFSFYSLSLLLLRSSNQCPGWYVNLRHVIYVFLGRFPWEIRLYLMVQIVCKFLISPWWRCQETADVWKWKKTEGQGMVDTDEPYFVVFSSTPRSRTNGLVWLLLKWLQS